MTLGVKITELPAAGTIIGTEQFEVVQSGQSKQVTANGLMGPHTSATGTAVHGLGTMSTQSANSVAITGGTITGITNLAVTGGTITGITDLAIADGGTGASTASGARTALGSTATGDALFTAATAAAARGTLGSTTVGDAVFIAANAAAAQTALALVPGTDVQAYDATLTSIASKGTAVDKTLYTTGIDTWAETPLTAAGRALIDDADAAAQRTTLGLVIGTDVQAYDATLNSIASRGTAADKMLYTTGIDTWAEAAITSAGRALVAGANAAAQLTTLGTESFNVFVSTDQTITVSGALTLAHGLGVAPRALLVMLVCQTAELNYSVGDVATLSNNYPAMVPDATNVNVRYNSTAPAVANKTTGFSSAITAANWKARFLAIK